MTKCTSNKLKQYMMLSVCLEFLCILHTYEKTVFQGLTIGD